MKLLIELYNSSVGKKIVMGLTGFLLCAYLVEHISGNVLLFRNDGGAAFDMYAEILPQIFIVLVIEYVLFAIFIVHIVTGTYLWLQNKRSRPQNYLVNEKSINSTLTSRTMFLTGSVVFFFLVVHMKQFWFTSRFTTEEHFSSYKMVAEAFENPWYVVLYVIAMGLLGFHLRHGFQSAFQTFGLRNQKYVPLIEAIAIIFWLVIPAGFAAMPIYFFYNSCHWFH